MEKLLGQGWVTSVLGYLVILLEVGKVIFMEQGLPDTTEKWFEFASAITIGTLLRIFPGMQAMMQRVNAAKPTEPPKE